MNENMIWSFNDGVSFRSTHFEEDLDIKYLKVSGDFDITNMKVAYDIDSKYQTNFTDSYDVQYDMCEYMYKYGWRLDTVTMWVNLKEV